ncbi:hypothetical protein [Saccharibacillus qingshengii]|uniref:hypothetical protein n=1 Tax=Saccharibacillus qingshengii TaxID=1763540 RepID=UPI001555372F|nr:hypothetical protein [Saccharibacillus qingshengii]
MKKRIVLPTVLLLLLLSACSTDSTPDSVTEDNDKFTAVKQIKESDFELRLVVDRIEEEDNTFTLEAGIRYTGDQPEVIISHGDPLFAATLSIDGEQIGGPISISAVGLSTPLKAKEWITENLAIQSSRTQIKQFYKKDGKITLHAYFDSSDEELENASFLSLKAEEIPR